MFTAAAGFTPTTATLEPRQRDEPYYCYGSAVWFLMANFICVPIIWQLGWAINTRTTMNHHMANYSELVRVMQQSTEIQHPKLIQPKEITVAHYGMTVRCQRDIIDGYGA